MSYTIELALKALNIELGKGYELLEAIYRVKRSFEVSTAALLEAYDLQ